MISIVWMIYFVPLAAFANRLEQAAQRGTDMIISVAQISSVAGICLGAIFMMFGAAGAGNRIMVGGIIAAVATYGGPSLIDALKGVFG